MMRTVTIHRLGEPLLVEVEAFWEPPDGDGWNSPRTRGYWQIEDYRGEDGQPIELTDAEKDWCEDEFNLIDSSADWTDDYEEEPSFHEIED